MAHPHAEHRQHKVERRRVAHITKGYAHGGAVHGDEAADVKLIKAKVKKSALKMDGGKPKHRADHRARGGRTKHKGKGTTVNIINSPQHPGGAMPPMMPPAGAAPPPPMPGAGPMPPRPMMPPPGMPMRARGGRIKDGPAWNGGLKAGTQVQHADGKMDGKNIGRGRVVTFKTGGGVIKTFRAGGGVGQTPGTTGPGAPYRPTYKRTKEPLAPDVARATGGKIESPKGVEAASRLPGGAGGGEARLAKEHRAERKYKRA